MKHCQKEFAIQRRRHMRVSPARAAGKSTIRNPRSKKAEQELAWRQKAGALLQHVRNRSADTNGMLLQLMPPPRQIKSIAEPARVANVSCGIHMAEARKGVERKRAGRVITCWENHPVAK
jgi:hypothetical protein